MLFIKLAVFAYVSLMALWTPSALASACAPDEVLVDEDEEYFYCSKKNVVAIETARIVRNATASGHKPPFLPLWDYYQYNRDVAKGLAPEQNRCAIVLSMTLGLQPRAGDLTLRQLGGGGIASIFTEIRKKMVIPPIAKAEISTRYYIQAQQLANRLGSEWGAPLVVDGPKAPSSISGKKGIIFLQDAYQSAGSFGRRTGDHIDVWNGTRIGSDSTLPFDKATKVWFWEVP